MVNEANFSNPRIITANLKIHKFNPLILGGDKKVTHT